MSSATKSKKHASTARGLSKCSTGIRGLDEITLGGLPRGRPTLVCGGPGCGKTLFGMEFLVRGITLFDEPGVCVSFEETAADLARNSASLGFDLDDLGAHKKLSIDYVHIERSQIEETGEYDLEGLFIRLQHAVDSVGAKRVLIDSVESLFAGLSNESILRSELRRLFGWLKSRKLTAVITAERGDGPLTRHGLEEYISDCVILLDHRVAENVFTRRMRVVKYRGSTHGTNEYPFLIDSDGLSVLPVTSLGLHYSASEDRISSGIPDLDEMLGGQGCYRGSSVLISGTAGTGKTSITAHFADAACARGERCLMFSFEEAEVQILRNMRSIGIDLERWVRKGLLQIRAERPTTLGLEMHLVKMHKVASEFEPSIVVVDPITGLLNAGSGPETVGMLVRMIDFFKQKGITAIMTSLTDANRLEQTDIQVSSIVDTWLLLRDIEAGGERNRALYVLKARGLAHSNQIREFLLTSHGVELRNVYLGRGELLTGSARVAQEARDRAEEVITRQRLESRRLDLERKRALLAAQMAALQVEIDTREQEIAQLSSQEQFNADELAEERSRMARSRRISAGDGRNSRKPGERK